MKAIKVFFLPVLYVFFLIISFSAKAQIPAFSTVDSLESYRVNQLEQYAQKLLILRKELAFTINKYIDGFDEKTLNKSSLDHLTELRTQLKSQVISTIDQGTSGEAVVAANKAKIDLLVDEINTIEKLFSKTNGVFTNELNIFSLEELNSLSDKIQKQVVELEKSISRFPSSETPMDLLQRKNELLVRFTDTQNEIVRRQITSNPPALKEIDRTINAKFLEANESILERYKGINRQELYSKKLNLQIELRLHGSPKDASLVTLKNNFLGNNPINKLTIENISARPPPSTWANPVPEVISEIRNTVLVEQTAIELRDPINIAKARTNATIYQKWLQIGLPEYGINSNYELLLIEDLEALKMRNERWLVNLGKEFENTSKTSTALEIKEAEQRIIQIKKAIQQRSDITFERSQIIGTKFARPPPTTLQNFESKILSFEKYIEAKELKLLIDKPVNISDINIKAAYESNVELLKALEADALTYGKGQHGTQVIDELVRAQKSVLENQIDFQKGQGQSYLQEVLNKTKERIVSLRKRVNNIKYGSKRLVYNQSLKTPSLKTSPFTAKSTLKSIPTKKPYPVNYQKSFPVKESWTKSHSGLIKDIRKAPGGVIIDAEIQGGLVNSIEKAEFDIFTSTIKIQIDGKWKLVDVSKDWTILRQAWAYVNDGRVAAVDLRPLSSQEVTWFVEYLSGSIKPSPAEMENLKKRMEIIKNLIPYITTVNLHPVFQNTFLGDNLILADQIIFDLLPMNHTRIEGQYKDYRELGFDIDGLRDAYLNDFRERNSPGTLPRSISKSIISVKSVNMTEAEDKVYLNSILDFAIYLIPNKKSDAGYIPMENSSDWFNENRQKLSSEILHLQHLNNLAAVIAFFKAVLRNEVEHNFDELVYLMIGEEPTPKYLFSGKEGLSYKDAIIFLEGKIE